MKFIRTNSYEEASLEAAKIFAAQIKAKPDSVIGLATGSTPLGLYAELARLCDAGEIDCARLTTVNLDEYYPIAPDHPQSYRYFMNKNLFHHINIDPKNTFVPDGTAADPAAACRAYDENIEAHGGIDLQLLGIGVNGHIGFNEPADELVAGTHVTDLTESTIRANSRFFESEDEVPKRAMTMGMANILHARKIVMIVCGANKREALADLLDDRITPHNPATLLKLHTDVTVICDNEAYPG